MTTFNRATFEIVRKRRSATVTFAEGVATVFVEGVRVTFSSGGDGRRFRPCKTHAERLFDRAVDALARRRYAEATQELTDSAVGDDLKSRAAGR